MEEEEIKRLEKLVSHYKGEYSRISSSNQSLQAENSRLLNQINILNESLKINTKNEVSSRIEMANREKYDPWLKRFVQETHIQNLILLKYADPQALIDIRDVYNSSAQDLKTKQTISLADINKELSDAKQKAYTFEKNEKMLRDELNRVKRNLQLLEAEFVNSSQAVPQAYTQTKSADSKTSVITVKVPTDNSFLSSEDSKGNARGFSSSAVFLNNFNQNQYRQWIMLEHQDSPDHGISINLEQDKYSKQTKIKVYKQITLKLQDNTEITERLDDLMRPCNSLEDLSKKIVEESPNPNSLISWVYEIAMNSNQNNSLVDQDEEFNNEEAYKQNELFGNLGNDDSLNQSSIFLRPEDFIDVKRQTKLTKSPAELLKLQKDLEKREENLKQQAEALKKDEVVKRLNNEITALKERNRELQNELKSDYRTESGPYTPVAYSQPQPKPQVPRQPQEALIPVQAPVPGSKFMPKIVTNVDWFQSAIYCLKFNEDTTKKKFETRLYFTAGLALTGGNSPATDAFCFANADPKDYYRLSQSRKNIKPQRRKVLDIYSTFNFTVVACGDIDDKCEIFLAYSTSNRWAHLESQFKCWHYKSLQQTRSLNYNNILKVSHGYLVYIESKGTQLVKIELQEKAGIKPYETPITFNLANDEGIQLVDFHYPFVYISTTRNRIFGHDVQTKVEYLCSESFNLITGIVAMEKNLVFTVDGHASSKPALCNIELMVSGFGRIHTKPLQSGVYGLYMHKSTKSASTRILVMAEAGKSDSIIFYKFNKNTGASEYLGAVYDWWPNRTINGFTSFKESLIVFGESLNSWYISDEKSKPSTVAFLELHDSY